MDDKGQLAEPAHLDGLDLDALPQVDARRDRCARLVGPPTIALVEIATGSRDAFEIGSGPRVAALMRGSLDLVAELGLRAGRVLRFPNMHAPRPRGSSVASLDGEMVDLPVAIRVGRIFELAEGSV